MKIIFMGTPDFSVGTLEALIAAGMSAFGAVGQGISLLLGNPANWAKIGHFAALAVASGFFIRTHVLMKRTVYDFIDATK